MFRKSQSFHKTNNYNSILDFDNNLRPNSLSESSYFDGEYDKESNIKSIEIYDDDDENNSNMIFINDEQRNNFTNEELNEKKRKDKLRLVPLGNKKG